MTIAELRLEELNDKISREYERQTRERQLTSYQLVNDYISAIYIALPTMTENDKTALICRIEQRTEIYRQKTRSLIDRAIGERVEPLQRIGAGCEFYYRARYAELGTL